MTIRPGEEWGTRVPRPEGLVLIGSDADLAAYSADRPPGLSGGDLFATVGAPRADRSEMQLVEVDGLEVRLDDGPALPAIAHVVVRRSWWYGRIVAVMNVASLGGWNVAPRAHPNDGRFDIVEVAATMRWRDRWAARRRLPLGTHVPHPEISTGRATERSWSFERPHRVWVDGIRYGRARQVTVSLTPDRYRVHV